MGKNKKISSIIVLILLMLVGVYLIHYALTLPCDIEPITQTVNGITSTIEQPEEMNRLICISTDFNMMVSLLVGSILVSSSVYYLVRRIAE